MEQQHASVSLSGQNTILSSVGEMSPGHQDWETALSNTLTESSHNTGNIKPTTTTTAAATTTTTTTTTTSC